MYSEEKAFKHLLTAIGGKGIEYLARSPSKYHRIALGAHSKFSTPPVGGTALAPFSTIAELRTALEDEVSFGARYVLLDPSYLARTSNGRIAWGLQTNWHFSKAHQSAHLRLIAIYLASGAGATAVHNSITFRHEPPASRGNNHRYWHVQLCDAIGGGAAPKVPVPLCLHLPDPIQAYPAMPLHASKPFEALLALLLSVYGSTVEFWRAALIELSTYRRPYRTAVRYIKRLCPALAGDLNI